MMLSPTGELTVRGPDAIAPDGGAFGATRAKWKVREGRRVRVPYSHTGLDLTVEPWGAIIAPRLGTSKRIGIAYPNEFRYHSLLLDLGTWEMKILYVWPYCSKGKTIHRGEVIGLAEDLTKRYPGVTNHVHVMIRRKGTRRWTDPLPLLEAA